MELTTDVQSQLLIVNILEDDLSLWVSTLQAAEIQFDEILIGSAQDFTDRKQDASSTVIPTTPSPQIDDADLAFKTFLADMRLTSDATYVESLQGSEEALFSQSRQYALSVAASEKKLRFDMALAKKLQDDEDTGRGMENVMGDIERRVFGAAFWGPLTDKSGFSVLGCDEVAEILASDPNDKGKGKTIALNDVDQSTHELPERGTRPLWQPAEAEISETVQTKSPYFTCGICLEPSQETSSPIAASLSPNSSSRVSFGLQLPCPGRHAYCIACLSSYIISKLEPDGPSEGRLDTIVFPIRCPECPILDWADGIPDDVAMKVLGEDAMALWHHQKFLDRLPRYYCPNTRCSAMLEFNQDREDPRAVCPSCETLICVPCHVEWHQNFTCAAFQALPLDERSPEDQMVLQLVKVRNWRRCPQCAYIVELTVGCNHVRCRCSAEFCFRCGSLWDKGRGRCAREPACEFWNEEMLLEAHERERDQEQPQGLEGMPAPPVRPFMLFRDFDTIFGGIMNPGMPGNNRFTANMVRNLSCGYCPARLNSVAALRHHLSSVRRHPVFACCGRLFPDRDAYNQHAGSVGSVGGMHEHLYLNREE